LQTIIFAGDIEIERNNLKNNPYLDLFNIDCINTLISLIIKIQKNSNNNNNLQIRKGGITIEEIGREILIKINTEIKDNKINSTINEFFKYYYSNIDIFKNSKNYYNDFYSGVKYQ
jgi:hypothetical protein